VPNEVIYGEFSVEQPLGFENGPIAAAEVGRHLAILGSCAAAAWETEPKRYYLATKAQFTRFRDVATRKENKKFQGRSEIIFKSKTALKIQALISATTPFASLVCEYRILSEPAFFHLFKNLYTPSFTVASSSPYKEIPATTFEFSELNSITATVLGLSAQQCAGHFENYPVWPVAIMAHTVAQTISKLLHRIVKEEKTYTIVRSSISISELTSYAQELTFHTQCLYAFRHLSHYSFETNVLLEGRIIGTGISEIIVDD